MSITNAILLLTNVPIVLVAIYAARYFFQFGKALRIFSVFIFLSVLIQLPSVVLYLYSMNNMPLLHAYTAFGGVILILFYKQVLGAFLSGKILNWAAIFFFIFALLDTLFFESVFTFNTNGLIVEAVIVIILALSTFSLFLQEKSHFGNEAAGKSINWINSGFFIYFCSNLLLYYFDGYLERISIDFVVFRNVWLLHSLFSITMYICFFIGLWKSPKH